MQRRAAAQASDTVALSRLGVVAGSARDQWSALARAFATAAADGLSLVADPGATYRHDGPLTLDGVSFDGQGCRFVALSDGPQVLRCLGSGWRVANVTLLGAATARSSENDRNGVWVGDEGAHSASDFVLENVTVDAVAPGRGVATAGIMLSNARRGRLIAPVVRRSLADGIHLTAGTRDIAIERALVEDSGDDSIAVVSYRSQQRICRNIHVRDATSRRSAARGFAVVGGLDVTFERVTAESSAAAGVYLYGEESFDTYGTARASVSDAVLRDCVTGRGLPSGFSNGAVIIGGRAGADRIDGELVPRGASACRIVNATIRGGGFSCSAAISTHEFALKPRITGGRIVGPPATRGGVSTSGIEIGGADVIVEDVAMTDIAGLAIVVLPSASGDARVTGVTVDGSRRRPGPISSFIYAENAPRLRQIVVSKSRFGRGPGRLSISLLPPGRLRLEENKAD